MLLFIFLTSLFVIMYLKKVHLLDISVTDWTLKSGFGKEDAQQQRRGRRYKNETSATLIVVGNFFIFHDTPHLVHSSSLVNNPHWFRHMGYTMYYALLFALIKKLKSIRCTPHFMVSRDAKTTMIKVFIKGNIFPPTEQCGSGSVDHRGTRVASKDIRPQLYVHAFPP